jgi:hypothetical protein
MRYLMFILAIAVLPPCSFADEHLINPPKEIKTRDELVKTFGTSVGFGPVQRAEFSQFGR